MSRLIILACLAPLALAAAPYRASVDTRALVMVVRAADGEVVARYDGISIGRGGAAAVHYRRDGTTPLGDFRIVAVRRPHRYGAFYQFDYPTPAHAELALAAGKLPRRSRDAIVRAAAARRLAPQGTPLGGGIGIHGVGRGDPAIHAAFNWTTGCIALSDAQLQDFSRWARIGMQVEVR